MADDQGKISIELNLETGQFQTSINGIKQQFGETGKKGEEAFSALGAHIVVLNEALELGKKALEAWHEIMELALETEKLKNQENAFKSFANSLGVDSHALAEAIKTSTGGAVTEIQSMNAAMDLMQSGVNAKQIPALTKLAEQIVATGHHGETFEQVIGAIHQSLITGSGRPMQQWIEGVGKIGDRQVVLNDILTNGEKKFESYGGTIDVTASKIKARSEETTESIKKFFGGIAQDIAFTMFADHADKAEAKLSSLEKQLSKMKEAQSSGVGQIEFFDPQKGNVWLETSKAIAAQEALIAEQKQKVSINAEKEAASQAEVNEKLKESKTFQLELLAPQKQRAEIMAQAMAAQKILADAEASEAGASLKDFQLVNATKKAEIERLYQLEKQNAEAGAKNVDELAQKLVAIEKRKYDSINAIRVNDTQYKLAQNKAIENLSLNEMSLIENAQAQHQKVMLDSENKRYQLQTEELRTQKLEKSKFDKEIEAAERLHQIEMNRIKDQYAKVSAQNLKFGIASAMQDMKGQYGNFTEIVKRSTKATQSLMTNSFVEAAKGHGNAMELMKQQFLEMIGTEMIQSGVYMMLHGIWPPNPAEIGAGAALVAAGSALVGASGSGAASSTGGGGGGPQSPYQTSPGTSSGGQSGKSAQIVINGDFLNSSETANHLASILRSNSDITDYAIVAQGKQYG